MSGRLFEDVLFWFMPTIAEPLLKRDWGFLDTTIPPSQAIELSKQLSSSGVPYKWIPFYGSHEFSGVPSWLKTIIDLEALQCISGSQCVECLLIHHTPRLKPRVINSRQGR